MFYPLIKMIGGSFPSSITIHNGLFLSGNPGTGKTFLVAGCVRTLRQRHIPMLFMTIGDLLDTIIQELQSKKNSTEDDIDCKTLAKDVELLVLDDIDKLKLNHWSAIQIFEILNERYNMRLPTIFTINHSLQALEKCG